MDKEILLQRSGQEEDVYDNPVPLMLTIKETAEKTHLSYDFIRKLCLRKEIVYVRAGNKYLINFNKFLELLNRGYQLAK